MHGFRISLATSLVVGCLLSVDSVAASPKPVEMPPLRLSNQTLAELIAADLAQQLQTAEQQNYDIGVEFENGKLTLEGSVSDPAALKLIHKFVRNRAEVREFVNEVTLDSGESPPASEFDIVQQLPERPAPMPEVPAPIFGNFARKRPAGVLSNQEVAEEIAAELRMTKLRGASIQIEYKNDTATLEGHVATKADKWRVHAITGNVPEVLRVVNRLKFGAVKLR
jgi:osmotically-inducible protein OsmY